MLDVSRFCAYEPNAIGRSGRGKYHYRGRSCPTAKRHVSSCVGHSSVAFAESFCVYIYSRAKDNNLKIVSGLNKRFRVENLVYE